MAVATNIVLPKIIATRVVAEATAIPKGTVMKLSGTNTVIASDGNDNPFGGITTEEFTGGENLTHVSCALDGVWDIDTTAAAVTVGQMVNIGAANAVLVADEAAYVLGSVVGKAESTRTGTNRIRVRLLGV